MPSTGISVDPAASTIHHSWIWEQGRGYFDVPLTNFLGWFFTTYVMFQLFAVFLRTREAKHDVSMVPHSHDALAILLYALIGLNVILLYLRRASDMTVTDAVGRVRSTGNIAEAQPTVTIFTMIFMAILAMTKLLQRSPGVAAPSRG